eukprot:COSAG01_NODE_1727_length_9370_cov_10.117736_10_plen_76_part_00
MCRFPLQGNQAPPPPPPPRSCAPGGRRLSQLLLRRLSASLLCCEPAPPRKVELLGSYARMYFARARAEPMMGHRS